MNLYSVILEVAKQEIVQSPYIMLYSWGKHMKSLKQYNNFKKAKGS